jgi:hypothetical protein
MRILLAVAIVLSVIGCTDDGTDTSQQIQSARKKDRSSDREAVLLKIIGKVGVDERVETCDEVIVMRDGRFHHHEYNLWSKDFPPVETTSGKISNELLLVLKREAEDALENDPVDSKANVQQQDGSKVKDLPYYEFVLIDGVPTYLWGLDANQAWHSKGVAKLLKAVEDADRERHYRLIEFPPDHKSQTCCVSPTSNTAFCIASHRIWSLDLTKPDASWRDLGGLDWNGVASMVYLNHLAIGRDGRTLAVTTSDGRIAMYDVETNKVTARLRLPFILCQWKDSKRAEEVKDETFGGFLFEMEGTVLSGLRITDVQFGYRDETVLVSCADGALMELDSRNLKINRVIRESKWKWKTFDFGDHEPVPPDPNDRGPITTLWNDISNSRHIKVARNKQDHVPVRTVFPCTLDDVTVIDSDNTVRGISKTNGEVLWIIPLTRSAVICDGLVFGRIAHGSAFASWDARTGIQSRRWKINDRHIEKDGMRDGLTHSLCFDMRVIRDDRSGTWILAASSHSQVAVYLLRETSDTAEPLHVIGTVEASDAYKGMISDLTSHRVVVERDNGIEIAKFEFPEKE